MRPHVLSSPRLLLVLTLFCLLLLPVRSSAADGDQQFADLGVCKLSSGRQIENCRLGYRTWGILNAQHSNAILFPTWFTGRSNDLKQFVQPGNIVDPARFFFIAVDALGDGVSSSPSNSKTQHGPDFPRVTIRDMVQAEYRLATETFKLRHLHAVMGVSMGGMQTFEWMVDYPDFMDLSIPIIGSPRLTSYDLLLWHTEEDALRQDPAWKEGRYTEPLPMGVVEAIHSMNAMTPSEYARENPREKFSEEYARYFKSGIEPFDANDWLAQLEAMIHHDVSGGGSMEEAAKRVKARTLIVVVAQDHMVNPAPALEFAGYIGARTLVLDSECGHLAPFRCKGQETIPVVREFLEGQ